MVGLFATRFWRALPSYSSTFCSSATATTRVLIMGPAGSGKGTIADRIVRDFEFVHLSCGDELRDHVVRGTDLGKQAKTLMTQGKLVPDQLICDVMTKKIIEPEMLNSRLLVDGYPRTIAQAKVCQANTPLNLAIQLNVPFDTIVERLADRWIHEPSGRIYNLKFKPPKKAGVDDLTGEPLIQRADDHPDTVLKRLKSYQEWEEPLVEFYKSLNMLKTFSGTETNSIWPLVFDYLASMYAPVRRSEYK